MTNFKVLILSEENWKTPENGIGCGDIGTGLKRSHSGAGTGYGAGTGIGNG